MRVNQAAHMFWEDSSPRWPTQWLTFVKYHLEYNRCLIITKCKRDNKNSTTTSNLFSLEALHNISLQSIFALVFPFWVREVKSEWIAPALALNWDIITNRKELILLFLSNFKYSPPLCTIPLFALEKFQPVTHLISTTPQTGGFQPWQLIRLFLTEAIERWANISCHPARHFSHANS